MSSLEPIQNINNSIANTQEIPSFLVEAAERQSKLTQVTAQQIQQLTSGIAKLEHGYHAGIPLHCHGSQCPIALKCPLVQAGFTYMINGPCPLEEHLLTQWINSMIKELRVDRTNHTEMGIVIELAKIDIYNWRIANKLSYEDHIKAQVVGMSDDGEAMYRDELHISAIWDDMLAKRRLKYMDSLLATRKSMAGAGAGLSSDPSTNASTIRNLLEKKKKQLNEVAEDLAAQNAKSANPKKD